MDVERALASKIITTGKIEDVVARGIEEEHFADDDCREVYSFCINHLRKYGSPPTTETIKSELPEFELTHTQEALGYLIDRFIRLIKYRLADEMNMELARALDDPERASNIDLEFLDAARQLATAVPSSQISLFLKDMPKRAEEYETRSEQGSLPGIPFGFAKLDEWTGGVQPHELVTVAAFTGLGKSTLLFRLAANFWLQGYTPMFISLEMEAPIILRKLDSVIVNLEYGSLKRLQLSKDKLKHWKEFAQQRMRDAKSDILIIDDIRKCTVDHVYAQAVRHNPDILIVDYIQLMHGPKTGNRWEQLEEITRGLKENARTLGVPIMMAAQSNRTSAKDGADLDNIGGGMSIGQDSDIVIALHADEEMRKRNEMMLRLRKNRDGRLGQVPCIWDHASMDFREKGMKDIKQMFKRRG